MCSKQGRQCVQQAGLSALTHENAASDTNSDVVFVVAVAALGFKQLRTRQT